MREIIIDDDTRVYYIYEDKSYYIENKATVTPRTTATEAKRVLDIVAPANIVTIDDLISLAETYETLTSLSYTWDSTGAYIKTIQLNDFKTHPITIDCTKSKLYIMNTQMIFDLTLTEGRRYRLDTMQAYYRDTLGLDLTLQELTDIYTILTSYYNPTPYNVIGEREDNLPLYYTNQVKLSNYRGTAPSIYTLTKNPNNSYTYTTIGHILLIEDNIITLSTPAPDTLKVGQTINVSNTVTTVDTAEYTADGEYTVKAIQGNLIYTTENLSSPYIYQPPVLSITAYKNNIQSVSRDNSTITLTNTPIQYLIGDQITVVGTVITTEYETLTVDGTYTITDINSNTVTVDTQPITDYTYTEGTQPYIYKNIPANNINSINTNHITVEGALYNKVEVGTEVAVMYQDNSIVYTTVTGIDNNIVTVEDTLTNFEINCGLLNIPVPYPETLVAVEYSKDNKILPVSDFMVDTDEEVTAYLNLLSNNVLPTEENYSKYMSMVEDTLTKVIGGNTYEMVLLGLYNEVYEE